MVDVTEQWHNILAAKLDGGASALLSRLRGITEIDSR